MEFYLPRQTYIQAKLFVEYNKDHEKTISSNSIIAYRTLHSKVAYLQRIFQYTLRERNTRYPKTQEKISAPREKKGLRGSFTGSKKLEKAKSLTQNLERRKTEKCLLAERGLPIDNLV